MRSWLPGLRQRQRLGVDDHETIYVYAWSHDVLANQACAWTRFGIIVRQEPRRRSVFAAQFGKLRKQRSSFLLRMFDSASQWCLSRERAQG